MSLDTTRGIAEARRWYLQRMSAMLLAICVLVHVVVVVFAVRGGLSGAEILGRTRGNWGFAAFYAVFVIACTVHVPIGLAGIAEEWAGWSARKAWFAAQIFGFVILVMGMRAVFGLFAP